MQGTVGDDAVEAFILKWHLHAVALDIPGIDPVILRIFAGELEHGGTDLTSGEGIGRQFLPNFQTDVSRAGADFQHVSAAEA